MASKFLTKTPKMKKTYVTLALLSLLFIGTTAVAQTQKGNLMVGSDITNLGLNFQSGSTQFNFNLDPKLAYFINDNFALGGYLKFGLSTNTGAGTEIDYGVGALARYYFHDKNTEKIEFSKRARFFAEANAGIEGVNYSQGASTNGLGLGIGPGVSYFITPNVALEGLLKYNVVVGFGNSVTSNQLNFGLGFQIYLPTAKAKQIMEDERRNHNK
jgi:hypothetical protein